MALQGNNYHIPNSNDLASFLINHFNIQNNIIIICIVTAPILLKVLNPLSKYIFSFIKFQKNSNNPLPIKTIGEEYIPLRLKHFKYFKWVYRIIISILFLVILYDILLLFFFCFSLPLMYGDDNELASEIYIYILVLICVLIPYLYYYSVVKLEKPQRKTYMSKMKIRLPKIILKSDNLEYFITRTLSDGGYIVRKKDDIINRRNKNNLKRIDNNEIKKISYEEIKEKANQPIIELQTILDCVSNRFKKCIEYSLEICFVGIIIRISSKYLANPSFLWSDFNIDSFTMFFSFYLYLFFSLIILWDVKIKKSVTGGLEREFKWTI